MSQLSFKIPASFHHFLACCGLAAVMVHGASAAGDPNYSVADYLNTVSATDKPAVSTAPALPGVTVSEITMGAAGSVVHNPTFSGVDEQLTGTYGRYNFSYSGGGYTYYTPNSDTVSVTPGSGGYIKAFSFQVTKQNVQTNVSMNLLSFKTSQMTIQKSGVTAPWPRSAYALGQISSAEMQYQLLITLDGSTTITVNPVGPDPYAIAPLYFTDTAEENVTFNIHEALKGRSYTTAEFEVQMKAVSSGSSADSYNSIFISDVELTPEPGSVVLTLIGCVPMLLRRRRQG